ncbi:MAG: protein kinase [Deltaproteobacteria bacterium]|nr:protein kinase [Deltaproteobacteria bacterium]
MDPAYCHECRSAVREETAKCPACGAGRPGDGWPRDDQPGRLLSGRYRVERRLAAGSFGAVFLATHVHQGTDLGRVVVKMLHPAVAADLKARRRFLTEVRVARHLTNPHIVRILDVAEDDRGVPFQVQEYVEGEGLDELLRRSGRLPPEQAIEVARQIAEGLAEAHAKQVVHRDLKPENIRLEHSTGLVKILDFGVARVVGPRGTATTSVVGTPRYMAPEQIRGRQVDGRTDAFALGVLLFELLAGEPPIPRRDVELAYLSLNLTEKPRPVRALVPDLPADLDRLVSQMLAKQPEQRPPDMATIARALRRLAAAHGWTLPSPRSTRIDDASNRGAPGRPTAPAFPSTVPHTAPTRASAVESLATGDSDIPVPGRRHWWWLLGGLGLIAVAVLLAVLPVRQSRPVAGGAADARSSEDALRSPTPQPGVAARGISPVVPELEVVVPPLDARPNAADVGLASAVPDAATGLVAPGGALLEPAPADAGRPRRESARARDAGSNPPAEAASPASGETPPFEKLAPRPVP